MEEKLCVNCLKFKTAFNILYEYSDLENGECGFCHSIDVKTLKISNLNQYFVEIIKALYTQDMEEEADYGEWVHSVSDIIGRQIVDSHPNKQELTEIIFEELHIINPQLFESMEKKFLKQFPMWDVRTRRNLSNEIREWNNFKEVITENNSFFPKEVMRESELFVLLAQLIPTLKAKLKINHILYRVRNGEQIHKSNMSMPPNEYAREGRLNPRYISVLYTAEEIETALAEIRPTYQDKLTVAEIITKEEIEIIDFTLGLNLYSFIAKNTLEHFINSGQLTYYKIINLIEVINGTMSKLAKQDDNYKDYLPTQYISMYIKSLGYDGLAFKSSVHSGKNIVLFSDEKVDITDTFGAHINNIKYEYETDRTSDEAWDNFYKEMDKMMEDD